MTHYFTLNALSKELDAELRGAVIREVFTQKKNELLLLLERAGKECCLAISVEPKLNYMFLRDAFSRAKRNTADLFQSLVGTAVRSIELLEYERTFRCIMENNATLLVQLYNTSASNVVLVGETGNVLEAFKQNKELQGTAVAPHEARFDKSILTDAQRWEESFRGQKGETILSRLKNVVPVLGSVYAREVLYRTRIDEQADASLLTHDGNEKLLSTVNEIFKEVQKPHFVIYYRGDVPKVLSVVALNHLAGSTAVSFESVNSAIRAFISYSFRTHTDDDEKHLLMKSIGALLSRATKSLSETEKQLRESNRAAEYERTGKIITAHLQLIDSGAGEIELPDLFGNNAPVRITLDPKLTPAKNAERYFAKAKKAKIARKESQQRLTELQKTVSLLNNMFAQLKESSTPEQVKEFKHKHADELRKGGVSGDKEHKPDVPFRVFSVAGGFEVWVGKSAANNDELTMNYSRPHDLWFHARGASGSHTLLKIPDKNVSPPKDAVLQAACIAAYYSKMRNAKHVPVAYCERKYVRKPKHSPAGTVVLEREKVIFVQPTLP